MTHSENPTPMPMRADYKFCDTLQEIYQNVITFSENEEFQRPIMGNNPIYFGHIIRHGKHLFGLSKFIAFKDITPEGYILKLRHLTSGGTTQLHIKKVTKLQWIPYSKQPPSVRQEFGKWIHSIFPNYNLNRASLMTIKANADFGTKSNPRVITLEQLADKLELQNKMGSVGEKISLAYEKDRLQKAASLDVNWKVNHISKNNVGAGYDIESIHGTDHRYIEVKATYNVRSPFYLTSHEYDVLSSLGRKAYIYRVIITDLDNEKGFVLQEIEDPIRTLEQTAAFKAVLYRVAIR